MGKFVVVVHAIAVAVWIEADMQGLWLKHPLVG